MRTGRHVGKVVRSLTLAVVLCAAAQAEHFVVGATSNIYLAGGSGDGPMDLSHNGGLLPYLINVVSGSTLIIKNVTVTDVITCNTARYGQANYEIYSADGGPCGTNHATNQPIRDTKMEAQNNLSGIEVPNGLFLAGVFLGPNLPPGPPPATWVYSPFNVLTPLLAQVFFIGDGLTGTGTGDVQQFVVPAGATRLFLGFVDGNNSWAFQGLNSHYGDNGGEIEGDVYALPEPATMVLMAAGLGLIGLFRRRLIS
ncbi:MAG: PEP-CTERM sorting domain-containing protein [Bryobacteraceae bacterium]|nr:PEP-CTERM sorting domain-containing protein [Bryobacteraceae bacterium]